jgi:hypothetical protein
MLYNENTKIHYSEWSDDHWFEFVAEVDVYFDRVLVTNRKYWFNTIIEAYILINEFNRISSMFNNKYVYVVTSINKVEK